MDFIDIIIKGTNFLKSIILSVKLRSILSIYLKELFTTLYGVGTILLYMNTIY